MVKNHFIGVNIIVACLFVLASCSNVVGFQTVTLSNQKIIKDEINQKELLFQTILDIVNNKEIQNIIQKYDSERNLLGFQQLRERLQKEIIGAIENNDALNERLNQLSELPCNCEKDSTSSLDFPAICDILRYIVVIFGIFPYLFLPIWCGALMIAVLLHCTWTYP